MAVADKEKVAAEIAAMDPAVKKAIGEAAAAARTAKKQSKTDKAAKVGWLLLRTSCLHVHIRSLPCMHTAMPFMCPYAQHWLVGTGCSPEARPHTCQGT